MVKAMRDSSLYIALSGRASELDSKEIEYTFKSLFEDSSRKVSEVIEATDSEIIYEIETPIVQDEDMTKEFYEDLEVLLYELIDYKPHFTQFRRVDS